jgi:hypothetical protein
MSRSLQTLAQSSGPRVSERLRWKLPLTDRTMDSGAIHGHEGGIARQQGEYAQAEHEVEGHETVRLYSCL